MRPYVRPVIAVSAMLLGLTAAWHARPLAQSAGAVPIVVSVGSHDSQDGVTIFLQ